MTDDDKTGDLHGAKTDCKPVSQGSTPSPVSKPTWLYQYYGAESNHYCDLYPKMKRAFSNGGLLDSSHYQHFAQMQQYDINGLTAKVRELSIELSRYKRHGSNSAEKDSLHA